MIEIIREREQKKDSWFELVFEWNDGSGAGFAFPCNEDGTLRPQKSESAVDSYFSCVNGEYDVTRVGVQKRKTSWWEPRVGRCHCGEEIELSGFANCCDECGRFYNMSGQELRDPSEWGEDTGEHPADLLRIL